MSSPRIDISEYTLSCVDEKLQPAQLTSVTTRSTLTIKRGVTICCNLSTIFYQIFHIHSYDNRGIFDTVLGSMLTMIWIICICFEFIYSLNGAIHLNFELYKSLIISIICVTIICIYDGELTAIAILIFMCIEMAITSIKCGFGGLNPNSLQNLIISSQLKLESVPFTALTNAGYFNGIQLIQTDFIEFYRDINFTLFSTINIAQRYPTETHNQIYNDLINIYNLSLDSHHNTLNTSYCCFNNDRNNIKTDSKQAYNLVPTKL